MIISPHHVSPSSHMPSAGILGHCYDGTWYLGSEVVGALTLQEPGEVCGGRQRQQR